MLQRVQQEHESGCFIAAVAMLLQVSYVEAFNRLFPGKEMPSSEAVNIKVGLLIEKSLALLPRVGLKIKPAQLRSITSLKKRTSLIIIKWKYEPELSHALVFDGEVSKFLDPCWKTPLSHSYYDQNLDNIYYVTRMSHAKQQLPISSSDPNWNQNSGRLSQSRSLSSRPALARNAH